MSLVQEAIEKKYERDECQDGETIQALASMMEAAQIYVGQILEREIPLSMFEWQNPHPKPRRASFQFEYDSLIFNVFMTTRWATKRMSRSDPSLLNDEDWPKLYVKRLVPTRTFWLGRVQHKPRWIQVQSLEKLGDILCDPRPEPEKYKFDQGWG